MGMKEEEHTAWWGCAATLSGAGAGIALNWALPGLSWCTDTDHTHTHTPIPSGLRGADAPLWGTAAYSCFAVS